MNFLNANENVSVKASDALPGIYNYMIGNDKSKWGIGARSYRLVRYDELYNGIDMEIYSAFKNLKYDFIVASDSIVTPGPKTTLCPTHVSRPM